MMLLDFLYLFIASALLGMLFGLVCAYCLRTFHFHHVSQVRAGHAVRRALLAAGRVPGQSTMLGPALMAWLASMLIAAHHARAVLTKRLAGAAASTDVQEVALIGMTAYLAYLAGDVFGLSGILAIFVCAVAISHYALHNISGRWLGTGQREKRHLERRPRWKPSRRLPSNVPRLPGPPLRSPLYACLLRSRVTHDHHLRLPHSVLHL